MVAVATVAAVAVEIAAIVGVVQGFSQPFDQEHELARVWSHFIDLHGTFQLQAPIFVK